MRLRAAAEAPIDDALPGEGFARRVVERARVSRQGVGDDHPAEPVELLFEERPPSQRRGVPFVEGVVPAGAVEHRPIGREIAHRGFAFRPVVLGGELEGQHGPGERESRRAEGEVAAPKRRPNERETVAPAEANGSPFDRGASSRRGDSRQYPDGDQRERMPPEEQRGRRLDQQLSKPPLLREDHQAVEGQEETEQVRRPVRRHQVGVVLVVGRKTEEGGRQRDPRIPGESAKGQVCRRRGARHEREHQYPGGEQVRREASAEHRGGPLEQEMPAQREPVVPFGGHGAVVVQRQPVEAGGPPLREQALGQGQVVESDPVVRRKPEEAAPVVAVPEDRRQGQEQQHRRQGRRGPEPAQSAQPAQPPRRPTLASRRTDAGGFSRFAARRHRSGTAAAPGRASLFPPETAPADGFSCRGRGG